MFSDYTKEAIAADGLCTIDEIRKRNALIKNTIGHRWSTVSDTCLFEFSDRQVLVYCRLSIKHMITSNVEYWTKVISNIFGDLLDKSTECGDGTISFQINDEDAQKWGSVGIVTLKYYISSLDSNLNDFPDIKAKLNNMLLGLMHTIRDKKYEYYRRIMDIVTHTIKTMIINTAFVYFVVIVLILASDMMFPKLILGFLFVIWTTLILVSTKEHIKLLKKDIRWLSSDLLNIDKYENKKGGTNI